MKIAVVRRLVLACLLFAASGCDLGMHWISEPGHDQVIRVRSGDRYYLTLEEGGPDGARWTAKSDNPDVTVVQDREDGKVKVRMWIHRGFDGPASVTFTCRHRSGVPDKSFVISFYKATIDRAFWE